MKVYEAELALADGATELDMVINVGKALSGDWDYVASEIAANALTVQADAIVKVIFENDFLTRDEDKTRLCPICSELGVAFVKTSTGYGFVRRPTGYYSYAGATDHDLTLMRRASAAEVQVKAAGGVRTLDDLLRVRALGVTRAAPRPPRRSSLRRSAAGIVEAPNRWSIHRRARRARYNQYSLCALCALCGDSPARCAWRYGDAFIFQDQPPDCHVDRRLPAAIRVRAGWGSADHLHCHPRQV